MAGWIPSRPFALRHVRMRGFRRRSWHFIPIERDRATSIVVVCRSPTTALSFSHYKVNLIIDLVMLPTYDSGIFPSGRAVKMQYGNLETVAWQRLLESPGTTDRIAQVYRDQSFFMEAVVRFV